MGFLTILLQGLGLAVLRQASDIGYNQIIAEVLFTVSPNLAPLHHAGNLPGRAIDVGFMITGVALGKRLLGRQREQ